MRNRTVILALQAYLKQQLDQEILDDVAQKKVYEDYLELKKEYDQAKEILVAEDYVNYFVLLNKLQAKLKNPLKDNIQEFINQFNFPEEKYDECLNWLREEWIKKPDLEEINARCHQLSERLKAINRLIEKSDGKSMQLLMGIKIELHEKLLEAMVALTASNTISSEKKGAFFFSMEPYLNKDWMASYDKIKHKMGIFINAFGASLAKEDKLDQSFEAYELASKLGDCYAKYNLGMHYFLGGPPLLKNDLTKAVSYFSQASGGIEEKYKNKIINYLKSILHQEENKSAAYQALHALIKIAKYDLNNGDIGDNLVRQCMIQAEIDRYLLTLDAVKDKDKKEILEEALDLIDDKIKENIDSLGKIQKDRATIVNGVNGKLLKLVNDHEGVEGYYGCKVLHAIKDFYSEKKLEHYKTLEVNRAAIKQYYTRRASFVVKEAHAKNKSPVEMIEVDDKLKQLHEWSMQYEITILFDNRFASELINGFIFSIEDLALFNDIFKNLDAQSKIKLLQQVYLAGTKNVFHWYSYNDTDYLLDYMIQNSGRLEKSINYYTVLLGYLPEVGGDIFSVYEDCTYRYVRELIKKRLKALIEYKNHFQEGAIRDNNVKAAHFLLAKIYFLQLNKKQDENALKKMVHYLFEGLKQPGKINDILLIQFLPMISYLSRHLLYADQAIRQMIQEVIPQLIAQLQEANLKPQEHFQLSQLMLDQLQFMPETKCQTICEAARHQIEIAKNKALIAIDVENFDLDSYQTQIELINEREITGMIKSVNQLIGEIKEIKIKGSKKNDQERLNALILKIEGYLDKMIAMIEHHDASTMKANVASLVDRYGVLCLSLKDEEGAEIAFQKAAEYGHPLARYHLGKLYEKSGRWDEAIILYQKAYKGLESAALINIIESLKSNIDRPGVRALLEDIQYHAQSVMPKKHEQETLSALKNKWQWMAPDDLMHEMMKYHHATHSEDKQKHQERLKVLGDILWEMPGVMKDRKRHHQSIKELELMQKQAVAYLQKEGSQVAASILTREYFRKMMKGTWIQSNKSKLKQLAGDDYLLAIDHLADLRKKEHLSHAVLNFKILVLTANLDAAVMRFHLPLAAISAMRIKAQKALKAHHENQLPFASWALSIADQPKTPFNTKESVDKQVELLLLKDSKGQSIWKDYQEGAQCYWVPSQSVKSKSSASAHKGKFGWFRSQTESSVNNQNPKSNQSAQKHPLLKKGKTI